MKPKLCAWCKKEDWGDTEASGLYKGSYFNEFSQRTMPVKAWLCEMHQDELDNSTLLKAAD